jgi:hypothetical protein
MDQIAKFFSNCDYSEAIKTIIKCEGKIFGGVLRDIIGGNP